MTRTNAYLGALDAKRARRRERFEAVLIGMNIGVWVIVLYRAIELLQVLLS